MNPNPLTPNPLQGFAEVSNVGDNQPCSTLFIGNLAEDVSEPELHGLFATHPGFKQIKASREGGHQNDEGGRNSAIMGVCSTSFCTSRVLTLRVSTLRLSRPPSCLLSDACAPVGGAGSEERHVLRRV